MPCPQALVALSTETLQSIGSMDNHVNTSDQFPHCENPVLLA